MKILFKKYLQNYISPVSILNSQLNKHFSILQSQFSIQRGFSLIELLAVIGVIGIISALGFAGLSSFTNQQTLQTGASELKDMLYAARGRALAQVKPQQCMNETLSGYQVTLNTITSEYSLNVVCGMTYTLERKKLPQNITFRTDSTSTILFQVLTGNPSSPASVVLQGHGKNNVVRVDSVGTIILVTNAPTPIATVTPTSIPTLTPTPTIVPKP